MQTVDGFELSAKHVSWLGPGEIPTFAARLAFASVNGEPDWREPLLVLTNTRLVISKNKTFGAHKADCAVLWSEVSAVSNGPWHGAFNPLVQLDVRTARGVLKLPVVNIYATEVENAIRTQDLNAFLRGSR